MNVAENQMNPGEHDGYLIEIDREEWQQLRARTWARLGTTVASVCWTHALICWLNELRPSETPAFRLALAQMSAPVMGGA